MSCSPFIAWRQTAISCGSESVWTYWLLGEIALLPALMKASNVCLFCLCCNSGSRGLQGNEIDLAFAPDELPPGGDQVVTGLQLLQCIVRPLRGGKAGCHERVGPGRRD